MLSLAITARPGASRRALIGTAAAIGSVLIWAGWIVGTRHAVVHTLDPAAVGVLRFAVPALVFAPVWWRTGLKPRGVSWALLAALMGAGAPFFLTVAWAMQYAPAADTGPLLPGTMPLFVALLSMLFLGERPARLRLFGLALIAVGIAAIAGRGMLGAANMWLGHAMLLAGALMWAVYTLAYKRSGLSAIEAAAVVAVWSTLFLAPLGAVPLIGALRDGHALDVIVQAIVQGILSGVFAIVLYGVAIGRLGPSRGAAFVALVPALAALFAIPVLGEWPDAAATVGIIATAAGVMLAAGAFERQRDG